MRILIKHPRVLRELGAGKPGKRYEPGIHEISDEVAQHHYTKLLLKSGDIGLVPDEEPAKPVKPSKSKADLEAEELAKMEAEEAAKEAAKQGQKKGK